MQFFFFDFFIHFMNKNLNTQKCSKFHLFFNFEEKFPNISFKQSVLWVWKMLTNFISIKRKYNSCNCFVCIHFIIEFKIVSLYFVLQLHYPWIIIIKFVLYVVKYCIMNVHNNRQLSAIIYRQTKREGNRRDKFRFKRNCIDKEGKYKY